MVPQCNRMLKYNDSTVILTIAMKECMDIDARPHVCGVFNACHKFSRWLMMCLVYISYPVLVLVSGDWD
jgi:hypothetical protein